MTSGLKLPSLLPVKSAAHAPNPERISEPAATIPIKSGSNPREFPIRSTNAHIPVCPV